MKGVKINMQLPDDAVNFIDDAKLQHLIANTKEDLPRQQAELTSLFIKVGRIQFIILSLVATGFIFFGQSFTFFNFFCKFVRL